MPHPTLESTIAFAANAHVAQPDKAKQPYILHPLRVMLDPSLRTVEERITAVLHDVMEDCGVTPKLLHRLGYSDAVVEALGFLTKREEEKGKVAGGAGYDAFIERVSQGPELARKVKLADLRDNADLSRLERAGIKLGEADFKRQERYKRAMEKLEGR